jgi:energy-converting hydrogenase B subunit E
MVLSAQLFSFFTAGSLIVIGIFAALFLDNLIKKIIGLAFIGDGANLFIITMGYKPG